MESDLWVLNISLSRFLVQFSMYKTQTYKELRIH